MRARIRGARHLASFDSSVNGVRAVADYLRDRGGWAWSVGPSSRALTDPAGTSLWDRLRATAFRTAGLAQGIPLDQVRHLNVDDLDEWVVRQYGRGPYPAVVIGSVSGGVVHLAAALGAPFLPQTTLSTVRDLNADVDDPTAAMAALAPTVALVAENNPRVAVYHMHDPAHDRPMLRTNAYLRLKRLRLGRAYERFLTERLAPGGTVLQVECTRQWGVSQVAERGYFQFGGSDGVTEHEYQTPGRRIARYLAEQRASRLDWRPPRPDQRRPEAEWGWDPALADDIAAVADRQGFQLRRLICAEPQQHSPFVADLYRWWYRGLGYPADRLLVESYVQWDPQWVPRTGSVPFWVRFNSEPSLQDLTEYLEASEPYDFIHVNLFSTGTEAPGTVPVERWEWLLAGHARQRGEVIGVDRKTFPLDASRALRYRQAFRMIPARQPLPIEPLTTAQVEAFLRHSGARYPIAWRAEEVGLPTG